MNRFFGNVYVIDSAGLWLTADSSGTGNALDFEFQSAVFVSATSGSFEITAESDTASHSVLRIVNFTGGTDYVSWPLGLFPNQRLYVKTCSVGTGYLYIK